MVFQRRQQESSRMGKENAYLYVVRIVIEVFAAPLATIEGTVEEYRQPMVCHV